MSYELNPGEEEILEAFENGELTPVSDAQHQFEVARQAARNTLRMLEGQKVAFEYGSPAPRSAGSA
ncbi:MAG: hypothetical protein F4W94_07285 [Acidimicrobiia bacterium]|nr:hypothetical protein [Acidimicrobiia bacterium]